MRLPSWVDDRLVVALILLSVAFVLRAPFFGNPDYHVDEEFYFLVAQRMWHGDLPFVDIWDRKPIGLFLIYAALYPFRQKDMLAVQIAGLLFATGTAYAIWRIALRYLSRARACLPALLYVFWLPLFGGANGQSPVFYNLFIAVAALLVLRANDQDTVNRSFQKSALGAMLLAGLAIQVKYTAVVESAFFGFYLVIAAYAKGLAWSRLLKSSCAWALTAFAPTLLALFYYTAIGQFDAFVFANFVSIGLRARLESNYLGELIAFIIVAGVPLYAAAMAGAFNMILNAGAVGSPPTRDRLFLLGWAVAALGGFLSIGNFYDHYGLPLLAPLLALAATLFEARILAWPLFATLAMWPSLVRSPPTSDVTLRSRATIYGIAAEIKPYLKSGPLFIYDGPSFLYVATDAKPPTRFAYPDHLSNIVEQNALGIDTGKEMERILRLRPAVIVTSDKPLIPLWNTVTRPLILSALARDYVEVDRRPEGWNNRRYIVNVRRDLIEPAAAKSNRQAPPIQTRSPKAPV